MEYEKEYINDLKHNIMETIINNNERVFLIHREGFFTRDYFVNLIDIPRVLRDELEVNDSFVVLEYWNKRFRKVSKKSLNGMFVANGIDYKIK